MFRFCGGAPTGARQSEERVHKASFYDPEINRTYGAMAAHYGVGILPARPYHPRDKAKVEAGVRMGRLRNMTFLSLAECNAAITLVQLNGRVMRRLVVSRRVRRVIGRSIFQRGSR